MKIKAIPTSYKGVQFRSKCEARWAEYFDSLGIRWMYEPEGMDLNGLWYLPDFWLPDCKTIFEVKGVWDEIDKAKLTAAYLEIERAELSYRLAIGECEQYRLVLGVVRRDLTNLEFVGPGAVMIDNRQAILARCDDCEEWFFGAIFEDLDCPTCDGCPCGSWCHHGEVVCMNRDEFLILGD